MRINEIIAEQQLDEGPLGSAVKAVGRGIGKAIGGVAKGVGAIAGIGAGAKRAFQKGKQASIDVIGGSGQGADAPVQKAAPAATAAAPAAASAGGGAPAAQPAVPAAQGGAQQKVEPTMQKQPAAGGGDVDAIIQQVDQLQPPEKKEVLAALQKTEPAAKEQPSAQSQDATQQTADPNATPKPAAQSQGGTQQPAAQVQGGAQAQQGGNFDAQTGKPTNQTGQNLEKQVQDAKQAAAQKMGRGLSPQEEKEIEGEIRGTMKPKAAPPADDNPNIVRGTESVQRRGKIVREYTEEFILYRPQTVRTTLRESRKPKQKFSIYKSQ
jgi:hypothetical protein